MQLREDPRVLRFVAAARQFRGVIENHELKGKELVRTVLPPLAELYAAGIGLESVDTGELPDDDTVAHELTHDEWWSLFQRLNERLGTDSTYWMWFDPLKSDQDNLVAGNLGDDLADIYKDVVVGLSEWDLGNEAPMNGIVWEWRFSLSSHWGDHALNALKALHCLEMEEGWGDPLRAHDE